MKGLFKSTSCLSQQEIIAYLKENLSDSSRYEVESHLLDCPLCNAAVEGYADDYQYAEAELASDITDLEQKLKGSTEHEASYESSFSLNKMVGFILFLFLAASAYLYFQHTQQDRWFVDFFEPAPSSYLTLRSGSETMPDGLKTAMSFYKNEQYINSLPHFDQYLAKQNGDFEAMFYAGIANLGAENYSSAIDYLQRVSINDSDRYEAASWYLALAYLKTNQPKEAKGILKGLINAAQYANEAKALLAKLNK
ncbi:MAG: hypothetical protein DHS20C18_40070 [Saprospiraceae bacterium]|nr:MAG: hypothetical protein DHS20C18_40070 [Saprospiraceae bacterium]